MVYADAESACAYRYMNCLAEAHPQRLKEDFIHTGETCAACFSAALTHLLLASERPATSQCTNESAGPGIDGKDAQRGPYIQSVTARFMSCLDSTTKAAEVVKMPRYASARPTYVFSCFDS